MKTCSGQSVVLRFAPSENRSSVEKSNKSLDINMALADKDCVVFTGGIFMDLVAVTPKFPKPGETVFGSNFLTGCGGKSSNQAVICKRLMGESKNVAFIGKLGDDNNGKAYMESFKNEGIDVQCVEHVPNCPNGVATIFVNSSTGENQIVIVSGANDKMKSEDIIQAESLIKRASIVCCALEMDMAVVKEAFIQAKENGARTVLNAAPGRSYLDPVLLDNTDILCVNESESEIISGQKVESISEAERAFHVLIKLVPTVIITLGGKGVVVGQRGQPKPQHVAANQVDVVDTTGAGDAFVGALVYFLDQFPHLSWSDIVRRSSFVATDSVQRPGTQSSYPYKQDLDPLLFQ